MNDRTMRAQLIEVGADPGGDTLAAVVTFRVTADDARALASFLYDHVQLTAAHEQLSLLPEAT